MLRRLAIRVLAGRFAETAVRFQCGCGGHVVFVPAYKTVADGGAFKRGGRFDISLSSKVTTIDCLQCGEMHHMTWRGNHWDIGTQKHDVSGNVATVVNFRAIDPETNRVIATGLSKLAANKYQDVGMRVEVE